MSQQSPIFSKTYDFLLWLLNHTEKFPKSERFRMGRRLEDSVFIFYDLLIKATRSRNRRAILLEADLELDRLRLYGRISHARGLTNPDQYQFMAKNLVEIGKLLGGWMKALPEEAGREVERIEMDGDQISGGAGRNAAGWLVEQQ